MAEGETLFAEKPLDSGPQKAVQREPTQRTVARFERRLDDSRRLLNPVKIHRVLVCVKDKSIEEELSRGCRECLERVQVHGRSIEELAGMEGNGRFILVVDDETAKSLPDDFRSKNPGSKVVLLTNKRLLDHHDRATDEFWYPQTKKVDFVFGLHVTGVDHGELAAMTIRACEDLMNIETDDRMGAARARRFIFLIVDDEPRWFSQFLPVLYEIIGTRASVMIARTFEEAQGIVDKHGEDIVCLITDILFPRKGKIELDYPAGRDLVELVKGTFPRIPAIVASTEGWSADIIGKADFFIKKGTGNSLGELRTFVHDFTGMGDFVFLDKDRKEVARAGNLRGLCGAIARLPVEILDSYAERDMFSTWLYMHGFNEVADVVKPIHFKGEKLRAVLLRMMSREARRVRGLHLVIGRDDGTRLVIRNLEELLEAVPKLTDRELERCGEADRIATWLTLKGNTHLADKMRVLHSHTERVREKMADAIREEMQEGFGINGATLTEGRRL